MSDSKPYCFIVCPIGEEGTPERQRSDEVYEFVFQPPLESEGYTPIRADEISRSGDINEQIIDRLINSELVLADLTGLNPNVMYELAIRHLIRRPFIQIRRPGEKIPFDISTLRTIDLDHQSPKSVVAAQKSIIKFIQSIKRAPTDIATPISKALDWRKVNESKTPESQVLSELVSRISELKEGYERVLPIVERIERGQSYVETARRNIESGLLGNMARHNVEGGIFLSTDSVRRRTRQRQLEEKTRKD